MPLLPQLINSLALGVSGFRVGTEAFAERNAAVTRGKRLAEQLRASIEDPITVELLAAEMSLAQTIRLMGHRLSTKAR